MLSLFRTTKRNSFLVCFFCGFLFKGGFIGSVRFSFFSKNFFFVRSSVRAFSVFRTHFSSSTGPSVRVAVVGLGAGPTMLGSCRCLQGKVPVEITLDEQECFLLQVSVPVRLISFLFLLQRKHSFFQERQVQCTLQVLQEYAILRYLQDSLHLR